MVSFCAALELELVLSRLVGLACAFVASGTVVASVEHGLVTELDLARQRIG